MNRFWAVVLLILAFAVAVAVFVFGTWVIVWNVNEILAADAANFWNVFWILLAGSVILGGTAKAAS